MRGGWGWEGAREGSDQVGVALTFLRHAKLDVDQPYFDNHCIGFRGNKADLFIDV